METGVQLFNYARKLTACALGEPSLTLVQNDAAFGLLLADGAHEDSYTSRLYLDGVTYLHSFNIVHRDLKVSSMDWCTQFL